MDPTLGPDPVRTPAVEEAGRILVAEEGLSDLPQPIGPDDFPIEEWHGPNGNRREIIPDLGQVLLLGSAQACEVAVHRCRQDTVANNEVAGVAEKWK